MPQWPSLQLPAAAAAAARRATPFALCRSSSSSVSASASNQDLVACSWQKEDEAEAQSLVVVGGGAAGVYASIRAKSLAPHLNVLVFDKGRFLSKVKISGGGRCNVTNGHHLEPLGMARNYPRGHKELRGSFFKNHGPQDTMRWFSDHGVELKTEDDGRVFPVTDNSASIVDCLLNEARRLGVSLQAGKAVTGASVTENGKFVVKVEKRTVDFVDHVNAKYVLVATGSSQQGYSIAAQFGHSIIAPVPSLFTFKITDKRLADLSGWKSQIKWKHGNPFRIHVTFPIVKAKLKLDGIKRSAPELTQIGPMLVTHWGLSGPVVLRLSAWGARELHQYNYQAKLTVDFIPDIHIEDVKRILFLHKDHHAKHKINNSFPMEFALVKRFWKFLLEQESLDGDMHWASIPNNNLNTVALRLKQWMFEVVAKGQFKDEFVTAGGVPLSEISLSTMESKKQPNLFFAGEVLNVDGVTGGFNFQNAWTGGYIAGTSIGTLASSNMRQQQPYLQLDGS
uniref:FAD-dependent oxidoreductase 2 FAD binding domain-containing protein n=1 Tax=Oryza nivara TaxID=4536 RepID=A0A0E0JCU0_ORYNI